MNENQELDELRESSDFRQLEQDYLNIHASNYLRTRVLAQVQPRPSRFRSWLPVSVSLSAVLIILVLAQTPTSDLAIDKYSYATSTPSISQSILKSSILVPNKPKYSIPGLGELSGISTLPRTPKYDSFERDPASRLKINPEQDIQQLL